jgi:hypothetical protein
MAKPSVGRTQGFAISIAAVLPEQWPLPILYIAHNIFPFRNRAV